MRTLAIALAILGTVNAQAPTTRDLQLRGGRFKPLSYDTMTPEQKTLVNNILAGPRTSLDGPFNVLLAARRWATWRKSSAPRCAIIPRFRRG